MRLVLHNVARLLPDSWKRIGERLYAHLPLSVRYGASFTSASKFLAASQHWTREQHEQYQLEMLKKLLTHAVQNVPFYSDLYRSAGVRVEEITSVDDIRFLPTISKNDLREQGERFRATNFGGSKFQYHTTGGSTGIPVGLYWEADRTVPLERAFMQRQWRCAGFEMDRDRSVLLRGVPVQGGKLYERVAGNQLRLSTYDLTDENLDQYVSIIEKFRPVAIQAYPSAATILARHLLHRGGHRFPSLKVVLCGSENLYSWQRELLARAFNCRIYSWYGQSEYVALAGGCEQSTDYHFYSEYGITEFIKADGNYAEAGETGEIVATGFNNFVFPLIRYRTEDLAIVSQKATCSCKRAYRRAEGIEGRLQEMIVSKNGNLISMTAINMHSDIFDNVHQFQFYQDTPGELLFNIVRKPGYSDTDELRILHEMKLKLSDQFDLKINYTDRIEPTRRGKTSFLIQKLPVGSAWTSDRH